MRSTRPHFRAKEAQADDRVEQQFPSFPVSFSAMAEPTDKDTTENPTEGATAQQPEALAAQIAQHLLTALQGGSQPPPQSGRPSFSSLPIPFHPAV